MALRDATGRRRTWCCGSRRGTGIFRVFGSVARSEETPASDAGLPIDFDADRGFGDRLNLADEPAALPYRHVDRPLARSRSLHFTAKPCRYPVNGRPDAAGA